MLNAAAQVMQRHVRLVNLLSVGNIGMLPVQPLRKGVGDVLDFAESNLLAA